MADLIYFLSQSIEVYPSGFRGQGYPQSKLTTEENITRLQSYSDLADGIYEDVRDTDYYILKISGYTFKFSKQSLIKALPQTSNSSENIYRVFAGIKLRDGGTNIGQVLAPLNSTLSSDIILDKDDRFQGLGLEITTNSEPTSTQFDFYTEIGLWVKSVIQPIIGDIPEGVTPEIITGYAFEANGDINDYIGTPLRYRVEQKSPFASPSNISILGAVATSADATFTELQIPKKVIFNSTVGSGDNLKYIPHTFTVNQIQTIQASAFKDYSNLTRVTIPQNITSIGESAFSGCSALESITLPFVGARAGVTSSDTYQYPFGYIFGTTSYSGGTAVTQYYHGSSTNSTTSDTYYIPSSLKRATVTSGNILYGAFSGCSSLTSITLPNSITSIGGNAFDNCSSLTSITIPDSVAGIGNYAFGACTSLTSIEIPDSVTSIGEMAFINCNNLTSVIIGSSVTSISAEAFESCSSLTNITIPDSVTSIGSEAFSGCSSLPSIIIPNSVINIGEYAFSGCSSLTNITIPDSVTFIGECAFENCTALTGIHYNATECNAAMDIFSNAGQNGNGIAVTIGANVKKIPDFLFTAQDFDPKITGADFEKGSVCESIGKYAFKDCTNLTSIILPDSITSIGQDAFSGCPIENAAIPTSAISAITSKNSSLKAVTLTSGQNIPSGAFIGQNNLNSITLPDSVTFIGERAFAGCYGLKSITIPDSVTSIDMWAFSGCSGLTKINFNATECADMSSGNSVFAFAGQSGTGIEVTIGANVKRIPSYLFYPESTNLDGTNSYAPKIISVNFEEGSVCKSIGESAFEACSSLTSIAIPESVTSIGSTAFSDCISLNNIVLPNNLESLGNFAFSCSGTDSSSISQIIIPEKVTEIASDSFSGRSKITKIIVHNYMNFITGAPWGASNAKVLWLMMNDDLKLYIPGTSLDAGSYEIYYRYINNYMFSIQDIYLGKLDIFPENFKINNRTILGRVIKSVLEPKDASGKVSLSTYMCGAPEEGSSGTLHLWNLDSTISEVTLGSTSDNYPQIWYKRIY